MKISRLNDNWNKVNTKEELIELLKEYRGILTDSMLNYLNSLIELEFSVIREYIGNDDRKALSELEVYKRIAIYNIYNRALNLFNQQNSEFIMSGNNDGLESLSVSTKLNDRIVKLFNFDYSEHLSYNQIHSGYKSMNIGNILLYQTLENPKLREAELNRVMSKLERLYDQKNPHPSRRGVYGDPGPQWAYEHRQEIAKYEKIFTELDSKKELSDDDKREIEITNQIHDILLEDYGLTNKSFEEENNRSVLNNKKSVLQKTLVRRQPNLTIANHIKYM